ncbi:hypothetical protein ACFL2A_03110, partial [Thermodesulfobacteriota bacterium]
MDNPKKILSDLPKVDKLLEHKRVAVLQDEIDKPILVKLIQEMLDEKRAEIKKALSKNMSIKSVPSLDS